MLECGDSVKFTTGAQSTSKIVTETKATKPYSVAVNVLSYRAVESVVKVVRELRQTKQHVDS